jgi:hypothetical protein
MGADTDLALARSLFPEARRAVMLSPVAAARRPVAELAAEVARIARLLGPCDLVAADLDVGTPDALVRHLAELETIVAEP